MPQIHWFNIFCYFKFAKIAKQIYQRHAVVLSLYLNFDLNFDLLMSDSVCLLARLRLLARLILPCLQSTFNIIEQSPSVLGPKIAKRHGNSDLGSPDSVGQLP